MPTLQQLNAVAALASATSTEADFTVTIKKWAEKSVLAKSTTLDTLKLIAKSSSESAIRTILDVVSETTVRKLGAKLDKLEPKLPSMSHELLKDHILGLATGRLAPAVKLKAQKQAKSSSPPKTKGEKASRRARGDLLIDSKY